ncbi:class I SAM-dependent methyltransferase [Nocardioides terrisoli]|uniref:class I SAM-dependent methyltransferase n=1 Tax=Nocardioides terrisoli TaxID=3388267 RepID=UPI00287B7420|nr:class I SAM-dependent methyltransferase [Nocardioides marmorisolisilvae]
MTDHEPTSPETAAHWDARYAERERIWSGRPNQALVASVEGMSPGRALDLGCGEGADSLWLAARGWQVTGVDVSATAIARARGAAAGQELIGAVEWVVADLADWVPEQGRFDLVSACFLHSNIGFSRTAVLRRGADAVAPGGHLLLVGHAAPPPWAAGLHEHAHELLGPAEELAELGLPDDDWETVVAEVRQREATGPDGEQALLDDSVVLIRRR